MSDPVTGLVGPPVPGGIQICQLQHEFTQLLDLYRSEQPSAVLEIGTASGGTLYHWLQNAAPGATIVSIDLAEPDYPLDENLCHTWAPDNVNLILLRGSSHDPATVAKAARYSPYQWLFIDACHVYEDAKADYDTYSRLVAPGGVVCLHDIQLRRTYEDGREAGVWRLWQEIRLAGHWTRELREDPHMPAYGIGIVRLP